MNGNGARNFLDVAPFGTALSNPALYATTFPGLDRVARGDMNGNGALNFLDVAAFGSCLSNPATCIANPVVNPGSGSGVVGGAAVPEPASLVLLLLSVVAARRFASPREIKSLVGGPGQRRPPCATETGIALFPLQLSLLR